MFGKITVRVGFAMEGQGQYTIATQLLADYFGTQQEDVRVVPMDTLSAPPHFGPGGSRLGVSLTGAVLGAADLLRDKLLKVAARLMQCDPAHMELMDGMVRIKGVAGAEMPMAQVAATMLARSDLLPPDMEPSRRRPMCGRPPAARRPTIRGAPRATSRPPTPATSCCSRWIRRPARSRS